MPLALLRLLAALAGRVWVCTRRPLRRREACFPKPLLRLIVLSASTRLARVILLDALRARIARAFLFEPDATRLKVFSTSKSGFWRL